ncbi:hypothetical protein B0H19DRAFT_1273789 [Mycena capillaripes]|nr:hypothetical protein B0H19DRAFT_1273789 [Mycena capillaripes]
MPFDPMIREWGIDWDDADNELFDYVECMNRNTDPEGDEWVPCVLQSLTQIGDLLGKAVLEALESHEDEWPGDNGPWQGPGSRFLLHNECDQYYGILDLHRGSQVRFPIYELLDAKCKFVWWYTLYCAYQAGLSRPVEDPRSEVLFGDQLLLQAEEYLNKTPHPFYGDPMTRTMSNRFILSYRPGGTEGYSAVIIRDQLRNSTFRLPHEAHLKNPLFDLRRWISRQYKRREKRFGKFFDGFDDGHDGSGPDCPPGGDEDEYSDVTYDSDENYTDSESDDPGNGSGGREDSGKDSALKLNGIQVKQGTYAALERNASLPRAKGRLVPRPLIIEVRINDQWCRTLVDSGSLGDFMSTTLADQLHVKRIV